MKKPLVRCAMLASFLVAGVALAACSSDSGSEAQKVLRLGGVPDQETARLVRRFDGMAQYLSETLGVSVKYVPSVNYAAVVTAFQYGDIDLAWFGGFTGVQARRAAPGSQAIIQRPRDADFQSVFIIQAGVSSEVPQDLKGLTFSFGSESSTSGHLMPRYFLLQAGVDADKDFNGFPNYSGSHDKTWKLVESGAFQAGALNEAVWTRAVEDGRVDLSKARVLETTPAYHDYHWSIRPDADEKFGPGFTQKVTEAFMAMGEAERELLDLFQTDRFIETDNGNYTAIEEVAMLLGLVE